MRSRAVKLLAAGTLSFLMLFLLAFERNNDLFFQIKKQITIFGDVVGRQFAVLLGLRKPGGGIRAETEARSWLVGIPGNRNAAPVAPGFSPSGAFEGRILAVGIRHRRMLGQPELFTLIDIRRTGQGEH